MNTWKFTDGTMTQQAEGALFVSNRGVRVCFHGIRVHVGNFFIPRNTAFQFMGHVFISRHWLSEGFSMEYFSHEYGHYLQQRRLGLFRYIFGIALPSVWSMFTNPVMHPAKRFERHATILGRRYARDNSESSDLMKDRG